MQKRVSIFGQLRDAFTLSLTKLRTRKVRTILTLITMAIFAILLVVGSSVLTGAMAFISSTSSMQLRDKHLASIAVEDALGRDSDWVTGKANSDVDALRNAYRSSKTNPQDAREIYMDYAVGMNQPSHMTYASSTKLDILQESGKKNENTDFQDLSAVYARNNDLLKPFAKPGQSLELGSDKRVPVLVPKEHVAERHQEELKKIKNADERRKRMQGFENELVGKTGTLEITTMTSKRSSDGKATEEMTPIPSGDQADESATETSTTASNEPTKNKIQVPVRVVGISASSGGVNPQGLTSYFLSFEAVSAIPELKQQIQRPLQFYPSFSTVKQRNAYVQKTADASIAGDPVEENKRLFKGLKKTYNIIVIVLLVLMSIPVMVTLSKILADSQRETGIFRAIGARNSNILAIYWLYALEIAVTAFLLALVIGYAICLWLQLAFADDIVRSAIDYLDTPASLSLVQFNVAHLGLVLCALIASGFIGSLFPLFRSLRRDPIKALRDE